MNTFLMGTAGLLSLCIAQCSVFLMGNWATQDAKNIKETLFFIFDTPVATLSYLVLNIFFSFGFSMAFQHWGVGKTWIMTVFVLIGIILPMGLAHLIPSSLNYRIDIPQQWQGAMMIAFALFFAWRGILKFIPST